MALIVAMASLASVSSVSREDQRKSMRHVQYTEYVDFQFGAQGNFRLRIEDRRRLHHASIVDDDVDART